MSGDGGVLVVSGEGARSLSFSCTVLPEQRQSTGRHLPEQTSSSRRHRRL